ncbi:hypothetical protein TPHA_0A03300 [Tetrapisispora phaffii CBS 4417]|uniref:Stress response RCI peptide n=1 Tax=Tetrapisispora phaffii (strain ATCC 24235 / CBS 4417 / NBRC 1672 / NRRL Y-8282 / UCD 70-5) TaxID=1071381 RepID=G8BNC9_TETPH|nr:hypothetical protein TPHA_0A03300 [Tetrapisispora phaffii CBS 4417]CCE61407.1 hypothetical protein TPHA_0A03300 [Tetrapisispora phaffii CBS 4417]
MCCCWIYCSVSDLILYIVAFFFPPVAVLLRSGIWSQDLLLNILLTMLGYVPGMIHAFYYINITSPLRNNGTETVYIYQQNWEANNNNNRDNTESSNSVGRSYPSVETPLLNPSTNVPGDNKVQSPAPPPYTV